MRLAHDYDGHLDFRGEPCSSKNCTFTISLSSGWSVSPARTLQTSTRAVPAMPYPEIEEDRRIPVGKKYLPNWNELTFEVS